jgi:polysaccharide biosynthesis protein PslH
VPDADRPRLLFAARRAPYPLDHGAAIRTYQLLSGLAASFDTVAVMLAHHPDSPDGLSRPDELVQLLPDIEFVLVPGAGPGKRTAQASSLRHRDSWTWSRYRTSAFASALARAAADHRPDVIHFDDLGVAQSGPLAGPLNVYCSHNVEYRILDRGALVGSPPRRLFNAVEARKVRREEQSTWRSMDLCLAVSPLDAAAMEAGGARAVEVCPNGVEPVERLPLQPLAPQEPLRLLFVGSGSYAPYERGLAWLVREVLPRVRRETPVVFDVVGIPPARPVAGEGVRYVGRVPTVRPHYETANVFVVPMFEGSGTRLKIIEAAAYGRPVVSTAVGAEGLPLSPGEHYLQADAPDAFAAAVLELDRWWRDPLGVELERMVASARAAILPLTWPRVVERLRLLYASELARRAARD